jgi:hypothetical protein
MHMVGFNHWLRTNAKYFLIAVCVVIMVTWLVPWNTLLQKDRGPQEKIFGRVVSAQEVEALARTLNALNSRQQNLEAARSQAWMMLILAEEAKRYGISAGDDEVAEFLKQRFPTEAGAGYDASAYAAFVQHLGVPESAFENALKTALTASNLSRTVLKSVALPEDEAWLWYARENESVMAEYVELRAEALAPLIVPDDKALKDFYEDHRNTPPDRDRVGYLEPEKVSIEYILCPYSRYLDAVVVTQQQVKTYYEAHKDQFSVQSQEAKADEPAKYKPLAAVADQIEAMLRREDAARAVDEDMKEVNDEIAAQTEVPFGSEEVRTADFAAIAKKFNLVHQVTDLFSADQADTVLPGAYDLRAKAFAQPAANIRRPSVTLAALDGKFVFQTLKAQDPRPAPFEAVRPRVEKDYRLAKAYEMAEEMADQALKEAPSSLDAVAAKLNAVIAERLKAVPAAKDLKDYVLRGQSTFFVRPIEYRGQRYALKTGLPGDYEYLHFVDEAFALKDNDVGKALEPNGARAVFLLKRIAVKAADRAEFDKNLTGITDEFLARKRETVRQTWLADVRRRAQPSEEVMKYLTQM